MTEHPGTGEGALTAVGKAGEAEVYRSVVVHVRTEGFRSAVRACWEVAPKSVGECVDRPGHCLPEPGPAGLVALGPAG